MKNFTFPWITLTKNLQLVGVALGVFLGIAATAQEPSPQTEKKELVSESTRKAVEHYTSEIDEIERVAALRKKEAKARLLQALKAAKQFETEKGARYHGMIGTYYDTEGLAPFLLLSVPDGSNAFNQRARDVLNAHVPQNHNLYSFEARGHVVIPKDGLYHLETGRGYWKFQVNGVSYRLGWTTSQRSGADVELKKGIYDVLMTVGNNGGQLQQARVVIAEKKTSKPLPIFIYESELKEAFRVGRKTGLEPVEVSGWTPKANRLTD